MADPNPSLSPGLSPHASDSGGEEGNRSQPAGLTKGGGEGTGLERSGYSFTKVWKVGVS